MRALVLAHLGAMRAQIGGLQAQVDALAGVMELLEWPATPEPVAPPVCAHLETENVGTFGAPQQRCTVCHAMVEPVSG